MSDPAFPSAERSAAESFSNGAREVRIPPSGLVGALTVPSDALGLVAFVHGSGSSRLSPRNTRVAQGLNRRGIGTLLFDLLTPAEEADRANVFDIRLLTNRLLEAVRWLDDQPALAKLPLGLFGASTGAAAALSAAAERPDRIAAVVSRGGRPDLAGVALQSVRAPTLLIIGGADVEIIDLNKRAFDQLRGPKSLEIVARATHLFPEPGALDAVILLAARWFLRHMRPDSGSAAEA